jgi:TrfA protein
MSNQNLEPIDVDDLNAAVQSLFEKIKANPRTEQPEPEKKLPATVLQLPLWAEAKRGMPNPALRSALFSAIHSKDRRFINRAHIAALNGIEIRFKGEQLNQEDLEVCAEVFHLARLHPLGDTCHTPAHGLLKALGRGTRKTDHEQVHASLIRLQGHCVEINGARFEYCGSLILEGVQDKLTRRYLIKVNPKLAPLFHHGWTGLDAERRRQLRGKPLALWLDAFYATHAGPYPYRVETLRELCGSRTANLYHFRAALRRALGELQAVGAIARWDIDADALVHVHKLTISRRKLPK